MIKGLSWRFWWRIYLRINTIVAFSGLFRCVICFEPRPNSFYACLFCRHFHGSFWCLSKVDKCPLCRKRFSCLKCTGVLPRNPLFIQDIEKFFDIPPTRSNALKLRLSMRILIKCKPSSANTNLWLLKIIVKKGEKEDSD